MIGGYMTQNEFYIDTEYLPLLNQIYGEQLQEVIVLKSSAESVQLAVFVENFNDDYAQYIKKCNELKAELRTTSSHPKKIVFATWDYANFVTENMPFYNEIKKYKTVWKKGNNDIQSIIISVMPKLNSLFDNRIYQVVQYDFSSLVDVNLAILTIDFSAEGFKSRSAQARKILAQTGISVTILFSDYNAIQKQPLYEDISTGTIIWQRPDSN